MVETVISADSHVIEPPGTYIDRIDRVWRDRAPRLVHDATRGDLFVIDGLSKPVPMGLIAAAGQRSDNLKMFGARFGDLHRGGWDPEARMADQARDGVAAEVIYPTVGMLLCNHPDFDYKHACFEAYNRWLAEFCGAHPDRLIGVGQTALRSLEDGIADLQAIKALGLRGVMLPGNPNGPDYDDPYWAPFFEAAVALELPPSFHVLTSQGDMVRPRGPKLNSFMAFIRGNQDLIGVFIFGGVFERHPKLRLVCVEADAGWVPHFMYRMDHAYERHRAWLTSAVLAKTPSEYFREHVYTTFQDDWIAFQVKDLLNVRRLLWANDFPHSDSTWPHSQELLARHTGHLTSTERRLILHDNVVELYGLDGAGSPRRAGAEGGQRDPWTGGGSHDV